MSNLNLICVLQPNVITKFRLLSLLPSGQCINKSYQQNLRKMYIDPEKAKLASFLKTFQIKKPAVAPRQACSSQILYLSNTTKITTNTETAMLSSWPISADFLTDTETIKWAWQSIFLVFVLLEWKISWPGWIPTLSQGLRKNVQISGIKSYCFSAPKKTWKYWEFKSYCFSDPQI